MPATWQLGVLLAWGFAIFNQLLFAGMEVLAAAGEDMEKAGKFGLASLIAGALALLASGFFFVISKPKRFVDWQVLSVIAAVSFVLWGRLGQILMDPFNVCFGAANVLIALWLSRGLWRPAASKKSQKA
ncbi:hypothetical protein VDG1235_1073 [Verrucomicrobiia bacterium DG1235]|nr:hypothetical protein VDG1235_1073 [Verrucomicrobiae bacterium DG1235]